MKKQNLNDLKNKTIKDLKIQANNLRKEIANLRVDLILGKLKNPHALKNKRKEIAQIQTLVSHKTLAQIKKEEKIAEGGTK